MSQLTTEIVLPAATAHRIHVEALLDEALAASFPSSDPIAVHAPLQRMAEARSATTE